MKTLNKTLAIGAALTAAVILTPAAFAQGPHHGPPRPSNGIQLAADIVNLVRAVFEPRPAPVIVTPRERVVETKVVTTAPVVTTTPVVTATPTVVTTTPVVTPTPVVVTTTPTTAVVTETVTTIPEYSYGYYCGEYVPYYEGWFFYSDAWIWGGIGPRPPAPPRWAPPPRRHDPPPRTVVVRPEPRSVHGPAPATVAHRAEPRRDPAPARTVVVRPAEKKGGGIPVAPSQHGVPRKGR